VSPPSNFILPARRRIQVYVSFGQQTRVHACPNCDSPRHETDRWGFQYNMSGYGRCMICGCRMWGRVPGGEYYEPTTFDRRTPWQNLFNIFR
jgi:hypothetical protein